MPLLVLFAATASRSYVELTEDRLVARFGWLSHYTFPIAAVAPADSNSESGPKCWPLV